jgi:signal transduction histidine kinase
VEQLIEDQLLRVTVPSSIRVERDLPADLPDLRVDPVQIAQVLMNLFSNSLQAMEGTSGVLSVRARKIGDRVRIEVADTGHGIPAENAEKVFEPLFTTKTRGIGLGLAVSRSLARANEGELTVVRRSGRGAVLALELPIVSDVPATKEDDGSLVDGAAEASNESGA